MSFNPTSLQGVITALITPFNEDGSIDFYALKNLIEEQIEKGVNALLPMGTTGESPTLSIKEHLSIIETTIAQTAKRVPVIAGTGSNSTSEAIELTKEASNLGADFTLQVAPYYNKPNQNGFYAHFCKIADEGGLPVILYNIPGRSGKNIEATTTLKLASHNNIVGVKEASGSLPQVMEIIKKAPKDFLVFSGDDNLTLPMIACGANGVISVASNIIPAQMKEFVTAALKGDFNLARELHYKLYSLFNGMFIDTNPIPVKTALALMGKIKERFRLPLTPMDNNLKEELKSILTAAHLL